MALEHVIKAAHYDSDEAAAEVLATVLNNDQAVRMGMGREPQFTGLDVIRIAKSLLLYADMPDKAPADKAPQRMPPATQLEVQAVNAVEQSLATEG